MAYALPALQKKFREEQYASVQLVPLFSRKKAHQFCSKHRFCLQVNVQSLDCRRGYQEAEATRGSGSTVFFVATDHWYLRLLFIYPHTTLNQTKHKLRMKVKRKLSMLESPGLKNEEKKNHPSLFSSPCCNTGEVQGMGTTRITPTFKCILCPREKQTSIGENT